MNGGKPKESFEPLVAAEADEGITKSFGKVAPIIEPRWERSGLRAFTPEPPPLAVGMELALEPDFIDEEEDEVESLIHDAKGVDV